LNDQNDVNEQNEMNAYEKGYDDGLYWFACRLKFLVEVSTDRNMLTISEIKQVIDEEVKRRIT